MTAGGRGLVLVVDDAPEMLVALSGILGDEHDVIFATSGMEAIGLARSEAPDLILLDVVMPEMDGYAVCAHLKEFAATKDIPVLFITGMGDAADEARGLELGAIDYIHKPVNPPVVRARVRNHMELKQIRDALKGLSYMDSLTGVANRRSFDTTLEAEWQRSMRSHRPVSMLMVDVDLFKAYNDRLGHAAGDTCLKRLAMALQAGVQRSIDLLARFGGEEFACVLPETDLEGALRVAQQLAREVAELGLPHPASPVSPKVTVSIGVACLVADAGTPMAQLVEAADRALYRAKREGRDRIQVALEDDLLAEAPADPPLPEPVRPEDGDTPFILLVEDDTRMAALITRRLEPLGNPVLRTNHAQAALDEIARRAPDLVLSDVVMPGMDGFELCKVVKSDPARASIPFVMLTALSRNLRERSAQAGADDYLSKLEDETVFAMRTRSLLELGLRRRMPGRAAEAETILVLSASHLVRMQMGAQLSTGRILTHAAPSLAEGLGLLNQLRPSVLAIDLDLGVDEPAAWIRDIQREDWGATAAILLVASKQEDTGLQAFQDLADDRLSKPLEAAETRHRAGLMLRLARARRASLGEG